MAKWIVGVVALALPAALAGCTSDSGVAGYQGTLRSCYDTGDGIDCVATPDGPEREARDVDGDGTEDAFVCADGDWDGDAVPDFRDNDDDDDGIADEDDDNDHSAGVEDEGDDEDDDGDLEADDDDDDEDDDGIGDAEDEDDDGDGADDDEDCEDLGVV